jgi:uncharacterized protein (DUF4415 family)
VIVAKIPKFKTLKEESEFWDTHSVLDYWEDTKPVKGPLIDARPKKLVPIRIDQGVIDAARRIAKTKGVGYQTLLRMWAYEGLARELRATTKRRSPRRRSA